MKQSAFFITLIIILVLCFNNLVAYGSKLKTKEVANAPKIDGSLNDPVWQQANLFTDFKMVKPDTGKTPSEKTELRVIYDKSNLYIAINCFTQNTGDISVTDLAHDQKNNGNDQVRILLDPFQDKRNAYVFMVNPKGARTDGLADGGERFSTNWDGIWDAKCKINKNGWSTEIRIPFKTISFNPNLHSWGFNVERYIAKRLEVIRLSGISKNSFFYNPAEAALLGGIKNIRQGKGITFKPYMSLDVSQQYDIEDKKQWNVDGGFDLYKNFTPNLKGVFTFQTDFAETEVDDRKINLTRFSLYFPEKRAFFLEGSDIFKFEGGGGGFRPAFIPFFSRRIGLFDEEQIPIQWGAKVYGKIGNTNMALLDVKTSSTDQVAGNNFFAGRIYQNIFSESKIGLIFTSGEPGSEETNTLAGLDFKYSTSRFMKNKNFNVSGWAVYNKNQIKDGNHYGYGAKIDYPNDLIDTSLSYDYLGDALAPGLGFIPRAGVQRVQFNFQFRPRPTKGLLGRLVRQLILRTFTTFYWDLEGNPQSHRISICPLGYFRLESGDYAEFYYIPHREVLHEPFEVSNGVVIPPGDYKYNRYQYYFTTANHRMISAKFEYETGSFYGGSMDTLNIKTAFNWKGNVKLRLESMFANGKLPQGNFKEKLYRAKLDFYLNADLGLSTYFQYDSVSENIGANIRFKWRVSPGNTVYLVYNKSWERRYDPVYRFYPQQDLGIFKLQFTWRP